MNRARLKRLTPHLVALFGLAVSILLFSPGHLDPDTLWQLEQARRGVFDDWHPPFMAWLWQWGLKVLPGSWPIFLIVNAGFWFGLSWTCFALLPSSPICGAVCTLIVGLWPASLGVNALVWKDALFASFLMFAFGTMVRWRHSRLAAAASIFCVILAALIRHNGILAAAPFVVYWVFRISSRPLVRAAVLSVALTTLFYLPRFANSAITAQSGYPAQVLMTFDLAGISVASRQNLFPRLYPVDLENLAQVYQSDTVFPLFWNPDQNQLRRPGFLNQVPAVTPEDLKNSWVDSIKNNPVAYFHHRKMFFCSFMNFCDQLGRIYFEEPGHPSAASRFRNDAWAKATVTWLKELEETWVFDLRFYVLILAALGLGLILKPQEIAGNFQDEVNIAFVSGFLYWAGYFFVGVASDFRYAWWSCLITLACAVPMAARYLQTLAATRHHRPMSSDQPSGAQPQPH